MKKIGRQVLFLAAKDPVRRNGEGAFIRLKNGTIMYAFTSFYGGEKDDDYAVISAVCSSDEGETWSNAKELLRPSDGDSNIMSVSLLRMLNGDLGLFFLRKTGNDCRLNLIRSEDEGRTWGKPVTCCDEGYYVVNNDRVIRLQNGSILFPANRHARPDSGYSVQYVFRSDDDGRTWHKTGRPVKHPFANSSSGLQESGLFQYDDGTLWAFARTRSGSQFMMFSDDEGKNWTKPYGSELFTSPDSPMQVKRSGPYTLAVFNPKPRYFGRMEMEEHETGRKLRARTPLVLAVSYDGGRTFENGYLLEDDPSNAYCYPALFEGENYFLAAYYHSNDTGDCLNSLKILKVSYSEMDEARTFSGKRP